MYIDLAKSFENIDSYFNAKNIFFQNKNEKLNENLNDFEKAEKTHAQKKAYGAAYARYQIYNGKLLILFVLSEAKRVIVNINWGNTLF